MCECACMFVCHDIMLLIGACAGHGIHGNNCEVSAHIPPSYLVIKFHRNQYCTHVLCKFVMMENK